MAKLYDDEEALDDEMKVFDMDGADSGEEKVEEEKTTKRQSKASDKKGSKGHAGKSSEVSASKINRLVSNMRLILFRNSTLGVLLSLQSVKFILSM